MTPLRFTMAFILCTLCLWGCKKYDQNGSLLHLRTPEGRLIGNWQSAEVTQVGTADTNLTDFMASSNLLLNATFSEDQSVVIVNVNEDITYEGIWAFNDDKSVLHLDQLTFDEVSGPFYLDQDSMDRADLVQKAYDFLQGQAACSDTVFLAAGTYTVMTDEVMACVSSLTATGSNWVLSSGTLNYNGAVLQAGDVINDTMAEYIEGFIDDELLDEACADDLSAACIEAIIDLALADYSATVEYIDISTPLVSGWDDPGLIAALNEHCGLDVVRFTEAPTTWDHPSVLGFIADNATADLDCDGTPETLGLALTSETVTEIKELDLYWEILELELDDFQAQQFREYDGETIADFNFLLRFEKQD